MEFTGNKFSDGTNLFFSPLDSIAIDQLVIKDNEFRSTGSPGYTYRMQIDTLIASGNIFIDVPIALHFANISLVQRSWVTNNIIINNTEDRTYLGIYPAGSIEHFLTNNTFQGADVSQFVNQAGGILHFNHNTIVADSLHPGSDKLHTIAGPKAIVSNNLFNIKTTDGTEFDVFYTEAAGDTAVIYNNVVVLGEAPHANTNFADGAGGMLNLGINQLKNFPNSAVVGATPEAGFGQILLHSVLIDSSYWDADTLKLRAETKIIKLLGE
jgi:hypothetical protein